MKKSDLKSEPLFFSENRRISEKKLKKKIDKEEKYNLSLRLIEEFQKNRRIFYFFLKILKNMLKITILRIPECKTYIPECKKNTLLCKSKLAPLRPWRAVSRSTTVPGVVRV